MQDLVYPRERVLGALTLVIGIIGWLVLIVGTVGTALIVVLLGFIVYLFAQSALIAHIKGNGVELSAEQFPDLFADFVACCERLKITKRPKAYVLNGNGGLNAFATKFLGTQYVVLLSDVADAMEEYAGGVRFYLGHELGHLRMKHLSATFFRWPALWLPLIGAAYSRARESTCDRHGLACAGTPEQGARALAALSAGTKRWRNLDVNAYKRQLEHTSGFWMSFHELIAGYPWLTKRAARVLDSNARLPGRNPLAYLLAVFVPFAGRLGSGFAMLILVYIVAVGAAIAIPAYQDYTIRAELSRAMSESAEVRDVLAQYFEQRREIPESLEDVGVAEDLPGGGSIELDSRGMVLTVTTQHGQLVFTPARNDQDRIVWSCAGGEATKVQHLPAACRQLQRPGN
jgi:Zn-dependent protease with chaperone function/type II secretory pathway pseudopilin PulG